MTQERASPLNSQRLAPLGPQRFISGIAEQRKAAGTARQAGMQLPRGGSPLSAQREGAAGSGGDSVLRRVSLLLAKQPSAAPSAGGTIADVVSPAQPRGAGSPPPGVVVCTDEWR